MIFLGARAPQFLSLPRRYQSYTAPCTVETQCTDQNSDISQDWIPVDIMTSMITRDQTDIFRPKGESLGTQSNWKKQRKVHALLTYQLAGLSWVFLLSAFLLERFEYSRMPLEVFRVPALNFSWLFWDIWRDHHARETVPSHEWKSEATYQSLKRSGFTTALYGCGVSPFSWRTHAIPWTPRITPAVGQ